MKLTQQILVKKTNPFYDSIDKVCGNSNCIYNSALYIVRQDYFKSNHKIRRNYYYINNLFVKDNQKDYRSLPAKVSQQTLRSVDEAWKGYESACREYKKDPKKFLGKPKIPGYREKGGRYVTSYTYQSISKKYFDETGKLKLSGTDIEIDVSFIKGFTFNSLCEVRLVPKGSCYYIEIVYKVPDTLLNSDNGRYLSIDLGVNNLCTISGNTGDRPFIINGKPIKSINQYYNKKKARLKKYCKKSKRLSRLYIKRENKIRDYFRKAVSYIMNYLVSNNINNLVVGSNEGWKQNINIGKRNNQNFVYIPFYKLKGMLKYKCSMYGINYIEHEESYTSKCSFLDQEDIRKHTSYKGKRVKRGLFRSSKGILINADVNGSLNILRKVVPSCFDNMIKTKGIEGFVVSPLVINF